jgi:hypothetical protein
MSCAHYAVLEAGRKLDALVSPFGADNIVNDEFFQNIVKRMDGGADVVAAAGFRLERTGPMAAINKKLRDKKDGSIRINAQEMARLLIEYMPAELFVDSDNFAPFPLFLCWRVKGQGILVRGNHLMPYCIKASTLRGPLELSIDPVDGRFLHRHLNELSRIEVVDDLSISVFDAGDSPLIEAPLQQDNKLSERDVGLWLWEYWDRLRVIYFNKNIYVAPEKPVDWSETELAAEGLVSAILGHVANYEKINTDRDSWRFTAR